MRLFLLTPLALLAACNAQPAPDSTPAANAGGPVAEATPFATSPAPAPAPPPSFVAADLVREQWARADNRARCAPIAFTDVGSAKGTPRAATFSGGWAVAFDAPDQRSAFGVAGPGVLAADDAPPYDQTRRLVQQWPHYMDLEQLARPSFAGYGLEGAKAYPADNPDGTGQNSLAYVRIHGQQCTYNIWSRLGRAHLETLLRGVRLLPAG